MTSGATSLPDLLQAWRLDGLGGLLAGLVLAVSAAAALYAPAYLGQDRYRHESRARFALLFVLFVAGMVATLAAWDLLLFLVCWEVMTLASYVLVAYETRDPAVLRAAFKYFVMTHCGTACLLFAVILLWVEGGSFGFDALPGTLAGLAAARPWLLHLILALLFVGFATKAGLYPFGDWLPDAHPAAPAPVSAVLSGVMIKIGLYGFLRFFVWMLSAAAPEAAVAWGYVLAVTGAVSALVGGLAASAAGDAKVLLAYSSVAQSGLISLGIGAGLVLLPVHPMLAQLALAGALFHVVGDAFVKALLFLNAGALQYRTGSRQLADMGGLLRAMPVTGWTALGATLAIAGFPPLTAFASKWLMLQATVLSGNAVIVVMGLALLIASVLSILYALKFFVAAFANRPMRTEALEVPGPMQAAQLLLAAVALVLSLTPGLWLGELQGVLAAVTGAPSVLLGAAVVVAPPTGAYAPLLLLAVAAWVMGLARLALGPAAAPRQVGAWVGGVPVGREPSPVHPRGFYVPLRDGMEHVYRALAFPRLHAPGWVLPLVNVDLWFYRPAAAYGRRVTRAFQRAHTGVPHLYIVWQLLGALALVLLLLWRRH